MRQRKERKRKEDKELEKNITDNNVKLLLCIEEGFLRFRSYSLNRFSFFSYRVLQMLEGNQPISFIKSTHKMPPARVLNEHWNDRTMQKDKPESLKFFIPWFISFPFYPFPVHIFWDPTFGKKLIKSVPWVWHDRT